MAKASDLIGKSGAGGLGPLPKAGSSAFTAPPTEGDKEPSKGSRTPKKENKSAKALTKGKGSGGGGTTSPSIRPKV